MKYKRKILISLAVLILLSIAFPFALRYKLQRDLANYKASLIAKGEKLTIAELIPPMPPNASNGMANFLAASASVSPVDSTLLVPTMRNITNNKALIGWNYTNHTSWKGTNWWPTILQWRQSNEHAFEALALALESPCFQEEILYMSGLNATLPNLSKIKASFNQLRQAVLADINLHHPDRAFTNLMHQYVFLQRWQGEPLYTVHLVRNALCSIAINSTWEFLQYPDLNPSQLASLQSAMEKINLLQSWPQTVSMERAMLISEFDHCRKDPSSLSPTLDIISNYDFGNSLNRNSSQDWARELYKTIVICQWVVWASYPDELAFLKQIQNSLDFYRQLNKTHVLPPQNTLTDSLALESLPNYYILSHYIVPELSLPNRLASIESQRRIAICAIALKRYQLAQGRYPESLQELIPIYLSSIPIDFMDGNPLRYRLDSDGTFLLYSIGFDGKDDGGSTKNVTGSSSSSWLQTEDMVWPQPATQSQIEAWVQSTAKNKTRRPRPPGPFAQ